MFIENSSEAVTTWLCEGKHARVSLLLQASRVLLSLLFLCDDGSCRHPPPVGSEAYSCDLVSVRPARGDLGHGGRKQRLNEDQDENALTLPLCDCGLPPFRARVFFVKIDCRDAGVGFEGKTFDFRMHSM